MSCHEGSPPGLPAEGRAERAGSETPRGAARVGVAVSHQPCGAVLVHRPAIRGSKPEMRDMKGRGPWASGPRCPPSAHSHPCVRGLLGARPGGPGGLMGATPLQSPVPWEASALTTWLVLLASLGRCPRSAGAEMRAESHNHGRPRWAGPARGCCAHPPRQPAEAARCPPPIPTCSAAGSTSG